MDRSLAYIGVAKARATVFKCGALIAIGNAIPVPHTAGELKYQGIGDQWHQITKKMRIFSDLPLHCKFGSNIVNLRRSPGHLECKE